MHYWVWVAAFLFALIPSARVVRADVAKITPDPKPILGNVIQCTAQDDGKNPHVVGWQWACQASAAGFQWPVAFENGNAGSVTFPAAVPVTYIVSCTVTYAPPHNPRTKVLPFINITIPKPASVTIKKGTPSTQSQQTGVQMWYVVSDANGDRCGPYMAATPQELLTDQVDWFGNDLPDFGWWPPSSTDTFHLSGGVILDTVWVSTGFVRANINDMETGDQNLRLHFVYPNGATEDCPIGTVEWTDTKVGPTTWKHEASVVAE